MRVCAYVPTVYMYVMSQVRVNSVHVRYEDTVTNPAHPMAVGITLDSIEMQVMK